MYEISYSLYHCQIYPFPGNRPHQVFNGYLQRTFALILWLINYVTRVKLRLYMPLTFVRFLLPIPIQASTKKVFLHYIIHSMRCFGVVKALPASPPLLVRTKKTTTLIGGFICLLIPPRRTSLSHKHTHTRLFLFPRTIRDHTNNQLPFAIFVSFPTRCLAVC